MNNKRKRAKKGNLYYWVCPNLGDACVLSHMEFRDKYDDVLYRTGNYFFTRKEAEKFLSTHFEKFQKLTDEFNAIFKERR